MPAPEIRDLNDYAVLWPAGALDAYGRCTVSAGVEIRCRWEDSRQESTDPANATEARPAQVFVDREIAVGSLLWHGRLANLPTTVTNLSEVTAFDATPDIKNRNVQRTATLARYGDALPEVT